MPSERERNRKRFPYAAERLDHLRSLFGPGVKLLHATQGADEIGEPQPVGVVATQTVAAEPSEQRGSRRVPERIPARSR